MTDELAARYEQMIERVCETWGFAIDDWSRDADSGGRPVAHLGKFEPTEDNEDLGLYVDDGPGELTATVVGAQEYHNEQVKFYLRQEGIDSEVEVNPNEIEPLA